MRTIISKIGLLALIAIFFQPAIAAHAESISTDVTESIVWENFSFSVADICSEHDCFYQASADADGHFIIVSRYNNIKENSDLVYRLCYIDVYSAQGQFLQELSFYTDLDFAAEIKQSQIYLYFSDRIITYDLSTKELDAVYIEPGLSIQNGAIGNLRQSQFQSGKWQYSCKKGFHGYTQLTRTDGENRQILVSYGGTGFSLWNTLIPAVLFAAGIFLLKYHAKRKKAES